MAMLHAKSWNVLFCSLLVVTAAQAAAQPQDIVLKVPGVDAAKSSQDLTDLQQTICPSGLERFVPGSYYYCVGVRDLANNHAQSGADMLKTAAEWGSKPAQYVLGLGYYRGAGLPMDRAQGLAWLALAAERKEQRYVDAWQEALREATPEELARSKVLEETMRPTYGDGRAAKRAERRYRHERDLLMQHDVQGAKICLAGITSAQVAAADPRVADPDPQFSCINGQPASMVAVKLDSYEAQLLEGWSGHVTVGELQKVPGS
jgi:TPR repeat protein